jgi:hypothetical protein
MLDKTEQSDRASNPNEKPENCYCSALPKGAGSACTSCSAAPDPVLPSPIVGAGRPRARSVVFFGIAAVGAAAKKQGD